MSNLRAAIAFLTRIPVATDQQANLPAAVPWFPVTGCLIGVIVGGIAAGLIQLVPPIVAAAVAVLAGVLITGAFHEDGLADVSDAFAGGWTAEQRIKILDDPLHGSYDVAALCGSIVVRVACVASLGASGPVVFACLLAAHGLARAASIGLMVTVPVSRPDGLGAEYARGLHRRAVVGGVLAAVVVAAIATGWWVIPFLVLPGLLENPIPGQEGTPLYFVMAGIGVILLFWGFIEIACLRGTVGPNRFGEDPLAIQGAPVNA